MATPLYFFLSYAHSGPSSDVETTPSDHGVSNFFHDLSDEVAAQAELPASTRTGFFDGLVKPGDDWKAEVQTALGEARIFVALYSPSYFRKSTTMRERESFRRRLTALKVTEMAAHIVPVLWTPFAPWDVDEEIADALRLADDVQEYVENGLRALGMLNLFRPQYEQIVKRVAARIVESATRYPLEPSLAPQVPEQLTHDAEFIVAVIAPSLTNLPVGRGGAGYGVSGADWRPFGDEQARPIADYAQSVAERLGSATVIREFHHARSTLDRRPGLVLIDPWIIRTVGGPELLTQAMQGLPAWATPLLVFDVDAPANATAGRVVDEVTELLTALDQPDIQLMDRLEEFVDFLPEMVTRARRRFLKQSPLRDEAGPVVERYTLRGDSAPPITNGKQQHE